MCVYPNVIFNKSMKTDSYAFGKSTRKKSSTFFQFFLDNTPPVRIEPVFFEDY
jgi:hypothetical protein